MNELDCNLQRKSDDKEAEGAEGAVGVLVGGPQCGGQQSQGAGLCPVTRRAQEAEGQPAGRAQRSQKGRGTSGQQQAPPEADPCPQHPTLRPDHSYQSHQFPRGVTMPVLRPSTRHREHAAWGGEAREQEAARERTVGTERTDKTGGEDKRQAGPPGSRGKQRVEEACKRGAAPQGAGREQQRLLARFLVRNCWDCVSPPKTQKAGKPPRAVPPSSRAAAGARAHVRTCLLAHKK